MSDSNGDTEIHGDDGLTRTQRLKLYEKAIRGKYAVSEEMRRDVMQTVWDEVRTSKSAKDRLTAARICVLMDKYNLEVDDRQGGSDGREMQRRRMEALTVDGDLIDAIRSAIVRRDSLVSVARSDSQLRVGGQVETGPAPGSDRQGASGPEPAED